MATTAAYRRLFLRSAYKSATDSGLALSEVLLALGLNILNATKDGRVVVGASANGQSYSFQIPGPDQYITPQVLAELASQLIDLHDRVKASLLAAGLSAADNAVFDSMLADDEMQRVTATLTDFTLIRLPTGTGYR